MNTTDFNKDELLGLIAEVSNGTLGDEDRERLNALLKASPAARKFYREHMELHARLLLDYGNGEVTQFMPGQSAPASGPARWQIGLALAASAAVIVLLAVLAWPRAPDANSFATLEKANSTRWNGSALPTAEGSRLKAGTLRLSEGMATLRFDSGVEVILEGPAELTLVDAMNCTLVNGIAMAEVPEGAEGFTISTASADIVDFGTRFSVVVDQVSQTTHTKVYEGRVEVEHRNSEKVFSLEAGQQSTAGTLEFNTDAKAPVWPTRTDPTIHEAEWTLLETVKDGYIGRVYEAGGSEIHNSDSLLLVKNGPPHRIAYLGFDLSGTKPEDIAKSELTLQFAPTGFGFASLVPDATFSVYGLIAETPWDEESLEMKNAPASTWRSGGEPERGKPGAASLLTTEVRQLGSFVLPQGVQSGQFGIEGNSLAEFLRAHAGSTVTLIVIRDTPEYATYGLVHGFASRRHPTLRPPTLAISPE